ncbi:MAG: DUF971 domain-containing protein, partial [Candidatus Dadabacteria bacterium]
MASASESEYCLWLAIYLKIQLFYAAELYLDRPAGTFTCKSRAGKLQMKPRECKQINSKGIEITWENGEQSFIAAKTLRLSCPCATCQQNRGNLSHDKPLGPRKSSMLKIVDEPAEKALELVKIWAIGNYAIGVLWGDGHDSGIYTFDTLYRLSKSGD